jgi:hypothetical protein
MKTKRITEIERRFLISESEALKYQNHEGVRKLTLKTFYTRSNQDFLRWRYIPELGKATITNKLGSGVERVELFTEISVEEWERQSRNWFVDIVDSWAYLGKDPDYRDTCLKCIVTPGLNPMYVFEQEFSKGSNISKIWESKISDLFIEVTNEPTMEYRNFYLSKIANIALSLKGGASC